MEESNPEELETVLEHDERFDSAWLKDVSIKVRVERSEPTDESRKASSARDRGRRYLALRRLQIY
jgi:hypothetical protein